MKVSIAAMGVALTVGLGGPSDLILPATAAQDAEVNDAFLSPYERRKAQMQRRKELLSKT